MSLQGNAIRANTIDTITVTNMNIGTTCSTISVGTSTSLTNLPSLSDYKTLKSGVSNSVLQANTLTISDLQNNQYFVSGYSSANPATANDVITYNMPAPTADIEGIIYTFRKIRGGVSAATTNYQFNFATSSYIVNNTTLTTPGQPVNTFSTSALQIRFTVVGYLGVYYWILA